MKIAGVGHETVGVSEHDMNAPHLDTLHEPQVAPVPHDGVQVGLLDILTWLGEGKRTIAATTAAVRRSAHRIPRPSDRSLKASSFTLSR